VSSDVADRRVTVCVRDSGPGIESEALPSLFERFSRASRSDSENGTGLGLAIAKALVEAQDGSLTIASQLGEGSVFSVTLPQTTVSETVPQIEP
jgi:signal transduction histidine kinase